MVPTDWNIKREQGMVDALSGHEPDYFMYHFNQSLLDFDITGKRVLVVGCNKGRDCRPFIDFGAAEVVGLDILTEIGADFSHERVRYVKDSVEQMPFADQTFDFVFSYATIEHVPNVAAAFEEIARVTKSGGKIYTIAAPLWCHREGPHWGTVMNFEPWIHLRFSVDEIVDMVAERQASGVDQINISESQIRHLMTLGNMNQVRAEVYTDSCARLDNIQIQRNELQGEQFPEEYRGIIDELKANGYSEADVLSMAHLFIATKI
jgi:SAM-dependent methyltransferase